MHRLRPQKSLSQVRSSRGSLSIPIPVLVEKEQKVSQKLSEHWRMTRIHPGEAWEYWSKVSEGLYGSMTKNQEVRESMTFLGTSKTWSSLCSEGEVESGKRWYQANYPRSLGFILESARASITGFSFQRRKLSGPLTELSWVSSDTTANNKKDASSLRTPDSIYTWPSCRRIQRKHFGHLFLAIKTESWWPDIIKTLISWEDVFWTWEHIKNHRIFLA